MNKKMNGYSVENLLVGKIYYSPNSHKSGEIQFAEKRENLGEGYYLITYRDPSSINYKKATIFVANN